MHPVCRSGGALPLRVVGESCCDGLEGGERAVYHLNVRRLFDALQDEGVGGRGVGVQLYERKHPRLYYIHLTQIPSLTRPGDSSMEVPEATGTGTGRATLHISEPARSASVN